MEIFHKSKIGLADLSNRVETDHICLDFQVVSAKEIVVESVLPEEHRHETRVIECQKD